MVWTIYPKDIAIDGMDNIYVCSQGHLQKFTRSGELTECVRDFGRNEVDRAGAAPQRVVGQMPMDAHAHTRVYQSFRFVRLLCMSVVFRQAHIPTLSPDSSTYVYPAAVYG